MDKNYLVHRTGTIEQIVYAKRNVLTDGKSDGMKTVEIDNGGGLRLSLLESRCLDIASLSYRGINMGFLAKPGLVSPKNLASVMGEFPRYYHGGMMYTCGLTNIGPAGEKGGKKLPVHGIIGITPAEKVSADIDWDNNAAVVCGKIKQTELYGENLVLSRKITVPLFSGNVIIEDEISNEGFSDEDILMLYHTNFGYPMLSEHLKLFINEDTMEPRDEDAKKGADKWDTFEAPTPLRPEEVFYHSPKSEKDGKVCIRLENSEIKTGASITYDKALLPQLVQWKSMASGDYALGIEPATARVGGYAEEKKAGRVKTLMPGEKMKLGIRISFYDI